MRIDFEEIMFKLMMGSMTALFVGFFSVIIFLFVYHATGIPCSKEAKIIGVEHQYTTTNGCWFKVGGSFVPSSSIVPVEKDGKIVYVSKHITRTINQIDLNTTTTGK